MQASAAMAPALGDSQAFFALSERFPKSSQGGILEKALSNKKEEKGHNK